MATLWTIAELTAQAALALSQDYDGNASGRVRDVPDLRTIRYYTTLGLLDRPAEMRGRTGYYGRRHLLQLVAVKRLQVRGQSLADIQTQLVGMTTRELERIARLPGEVASTEPAECERADDFWKIPPPTGRKTEPAPGSSSPEFTPPPAPLQGVPLDEAVTLLFAAARPLEPDDVAAVRAAAAPLLKLLRQRHLHPSRRERNPG